MAVSETWLRRWYVFAVVLMLIGITLAIIDPKFDSMAAMAFRIIFGVVTAALVIGFNLLMFVVGCRREQRWRKGVLILLFLLLPVLFGFLYYWRIPPPRHV
jgi:hypothetical protein